MNMGKDLTEVRSPQRQLVPDKVGLEQGEPTFLRGIASKAKSNKRHRFRDLYRYLNEELLHDAWATLNKGAASGVDEVTAEAYAQDLHANIQRLVERLKAKRYRTKQETFWRAVDRGLFRKPRITAGLSRRVSV